MERKSEINRELEELEYLFRFLCILDPASLDKVLEAESLLVCAILNIKDVEPAKDAFNNMLREFENNKTEYPLFARSQYNNNLSTSHVLNAILVRLQKRGLYTDLDRFLQSVFSFDNDTITKRLLGLGGMDTFHLQG